MDLPEQVRGMFYKCYESVGGLIDEWRPPEPGLMLALDEVAEVVLEMLSRENWYINTVFMVFSQTVSVLWLFVIHSDVTMVLLETKHQSIFPSHYLLKALLIHQFAIHQLLLRKRGLPFHQAVPRLRQGPRGEEHGPGVVFCLD